MQKGLIIYSGGMDSTVLLHDYFQKGIIKMAVSFNYGSKHNDKEFEYAQRNTKKLNIPHLRIDLKDVMKDFKSDLLKSGGEIPEGHYADDNMRKTVVPFRNGIMLSIAAGLAESFGMDSIFIANHFGDFSQYADCRSEFIIPMTKAIEEGTFAKIKLVAPYTSILKRDIALKGKEIGVDLNDTWSCYKGGEHHCGRCGTCVERKEAMSGFDTTVYLDEEYCIPAVRK